MFSNNNYCSCLYQIYPMLVVMDMMDILIMHFVIDVCHDRNNGNMYGDYLKILQQFRNSVMYHMLIFMLLWYWWCIVWFIWEELYSRHRLQVTRRRFSAQFTTVLSNQTKRIDASQIIWKIHHKCYKSINIKTWSTTMVLNCCNIFR